MKITFFIVPILLLVWITSCKEKSSAVGYAQQICNPGKKSNESGLFYVSDACDTVATLSEGKYMTSFSHGANPLLDDSLSTALFGLDLRPYLALLKQMSLVEYDFQAEKVGNRVYCKGAEPSKEMQLIAEKLLSATGSIGSIIIFSNGEQITFLGETRGIQPLYETWKVSQTKRLGIKFSFSKLFVSEDGAFEGFTLRWPTIVVPVQIGTHKDYFEIPLKAKDADHYHEEKVLSSYLQVTKESILQGKWSFSFPNNIQGHLFNGRVVALSTPCSKNKIHLIDNSETKPALKADSSDLLFNLALPDKSQPFMTLDGKKVSVMSPPCEVELLSTNFLRHIAGKKVVLVE